MHAQGTWNVVNNNKHISLAYKPSVRPFGLSLSLDLDPTCVHIVKRTNLGHGNNKNKRE